jgi:hypothetical protein
LQFNHRVELWNISGMAWNAVFTASVSGIEDKHVSKLNYVFHVVS